MLLKQLVDAFLTVVVMEKHDQAGLKKTTTVKQIQPQYTRGYRHGGAYFQREGGGALAPPDTPPPPPPWLRRLWGIRHFDISRVKNKADTFVTETFSMNLNVFLNVAP